MRDLFQSLFGLHAYRVFSQTYNSLRRMIRPKREAEEIFLEKFVQEGSTSFEIGANYGQYIRVLSPLSGGEGRVFAFEPASITFDCLRRVTKLLGLKNVSLNHLALSNEPGILELHTPVKKKGTIGVAQASLAPDPELEILTETCEVDTIDSFVAKQNISKIDFIRCDVEGNELNVLKGGEKTIKDHQPPMLIEVHPGMLQRFGHSLDMVQEFGRENGYRFYVVRNDALKEIENLRDDPQLMNDDNVFFIPERLQP